MHADARQKEPQSPVDVQKGINTIANNLKEGKAVMVGVMYNENKNTGNDNAATNHYVTIVGSGNDKHGTYFSYYDNYGGGTNVSSEDRQRAGTDLSENRFYYNSTTNQLVDDRTILGRYIVTEVRPNITNPVVHNEPR